MLKTYSSQMHKSVVSLMLHSLQSCNFQFSRIFTCKKQFCPVLKILGECDHQEYLVMACEHKPL